MSKKNTTEEPKHPEAQDLAGLDRSKPVAARITTWLLTVLPAEIRPKVEAAFAALFAEQRGFVRNGNRTAYNLDQLAFTSSKIEPTSDGPVYVTSTMKGRRPEDTVFAYLFDHVSTYVFPPTPRGDSTPEKPKFQRHVKARTAWVASLGFSKAEVGKGSRNTLSLEIPGTRELLADVAALTPEVFEGTEKPKPASKAFIKIVLPASLGSIEARISVYDPEHPTVTEALFREDLEKVSILLSNGASIPEKDGVLGRMESLYFTAYTAQRQAQAAQTVAA